MNHERSELGPTRSPAIPRSASGQAHDTGTEQELSIDIAEEVAEAIDTDPIALHPLYESIDPDALTQLVHAGDTRVHVEFQYMGQMVTVRGNGEVEVTEPTEP